MAPGRHELSCFNPRGRVLIKDPFAFHNERSIVLQKPDPTKVTLYEYPETLLHEVSAMQELKETEAEFRGTPFEISLSFQMRNLLMQRILSQTLCSMRFDMCSKIPQHDHTRGLPQCQSTR